MIIAKDQTAEFNGMAVAETLKGLIVYNFSENTYEVAEGNKRYFAGIQDLQNASWYSEEERLAAMPYIANLEQVAGFLKEASEVDWQSEN